MKPVRLTIVTALCLTLALAGRPSFAAAPGADPAGSAGLQQLPPATSQPQTTPTPANLDRIREAVNRPPALKVENGQLRIYVEVIAHWPTFAEVNKGYDFMHGPTGGGDPMTHAEFVDMVTPREMYSTVGINPAEMLTFAVVNYVGMKAITKGLQAIHKARSAKEIDDIRSQIDRELAALKRGG